MGILKPVPGLEKGRVAHLRGEWITAAQAHGHGGERLAVLHFTHHPIGFVCTEHPERCYS
jgi:endonuclease G